MAYIITEPCIDVKDGSFTAACPVDSIYEGGRMFYIHPDECINCGLCLSICPVDAIVWDGEMQPRHKPFEAARRLEIDRRQPSVLHDRTAVHDQAAHMAGRHATEQNPCLVEVVEHGVFNEGRVVGHDEVAGRRLVDHGGAARNRGVEDFAGRDRRVQSAPAMQQMEQAHSVRAG